MRFTSDVELVNWSCCSVKLVTFVTFPVVHDLVVVFNQSDFGVIFSLADAMVVVIESFIFASVADHMIADVRMLVNPAYFR